MNLGKKNNNSVLKHRLEMPNSSFMTWNYYASRNKQLLFLGFNICNTIMFS